MNLQDFFNKYNNKVVDYDGFYGGQCVDLYRIYCAELGFPQSPPIAGAADIWTTYRKCCFTPIKNTPTAVPQPGDVVIWNKSLNGFGHVAIFQSGNVWNFTSFDQNFPNGSPCHFQKHNYKYVIGWLRPIIKQPIKGTVTVARIGSNLPPGDEFKAEVAKYTNNNLAVVLKDYNVPIKDTGMMTQDEAYDFLRMVKVFDGKVDADFVQFYYQSPEAPFLVSYSFPEQKKYISTLPNNPPARLIAFELAHCLQFYLNENFQAQIQVEDSNFPDEAFIQKKYNTVAKFLDKFK